MNSVDPGLTVELDLRLFIHDCHKKKYSTHELKDFARLIYSNDVYEQHHGAIGLRKVVCLGFLHLSSETNHFSCTDQFINERIIEAGLIPRLAELARQEQYPTLQVRFFLLKSLGNKSNSLKPYGH